MRFIPRPAAGSPVNTTVAMNSLTSTAVNTKAVAIGLTPGVTDINNERVFYWVEARSNATGTVDALLPATGVLLYFVNENVPG